MFERNNKRSTWRTAVCSILVLLLTLGMGVSTAFATDPDGAGEQKGPISEIGNAKDESDISKFNIGQPSDTNATETATQMVLNKEYYAVYKDAITYMKQPVTIKVTAKMTYQGDNADRYKEEKGKDPAGSSDDVTYWAYNYTKPGETTATEIWRYSGKYYKDTSSCEEVTPDDSGTLKQVVAALDEPRSNDPTYHTNVYINGSGQLTVTWTRSFHTKIDWGIEMLDKNGNPLDNNLAAGIMDPDESNYLFPTTRSLYYVSASESGEGAKDFGETFYVYENGIYPMVQRTNAEGEEDLNNQAVGFDEGKILVGMEGSSSFNFITDTFNGGYLAAPFIFKVEFKASYTSDDGGTITGIEGEDVDDGDNPSGSKEKTKDGYRFTGWTADVDVTLKDGTTIPAGTVLTEEQIKNIVMDKDIKFTANHELIPKITVSKKIDKKEVVVGDTVKYTIKIKQTVDGAVAKNVEITDELDDGLKLDKKSLKKGLKNVATDIKATSSGYTATIPELSDEIAFTYKAKVTKSGKKLKNTVVVSYDGGEEDGDQKIEVDAEASVKAIHPLIAKTGDDPAILASMMAMLISLMAFGLGAVTKKRKA